MIKHNFGMFDFSSGMDSLESIDVIDSKKHIVKLLAYGTIRKNIKKRKFGMSLLSHFGFNPHTFLGLNQCQNRTNYHSKL